MSTTVKLFSGDMPRTKSDPVTGFTLAVLECAENGFAGPVTANGVISYGRAYDDVGSCISQFSVGVSNDGSLSALSLDTCSAVIDGTVTIPATVVAAAIERYCE